jgi:predicted nucleic acid-binding Zn ribbon protein
MEDFESLTKKQITDRLQDDLEFALNFMVDNQPDLIISELQANGSENVIDTDTAYNNLLWLAENNPLKLRLILKDIPYDNSAANYTGHLKESVVQDDEIQTKSWDWTTILAVAGMAIPIIGTLVGGGGGGTIQPTQAQILQAQQEAQRLEDERKAKRNLYIIGGVIVVVFIVVLVVLRYKKGKK